MSLVAAAVSLLFVVSAIVAVRGGWPGIGPQDDAPGLVLTDSPSGRPAPAGVTVAPAAATAGDATVVLGREAGPGAARRGSSRGPSNTPDVPGQNGPGTTAPVGGSAPSQGTAPAAQTPPSTPPGTSPSLVRDTTTAVGETVRDAGNAVGGTVDTVAPGGGEPIRNTANTVADAVEQVGGAVQNTTQNVGRTAQPVTDTAGQAVSDLGAPRLGNAVQDTGKAVTGLLGE